MLIRNRGAQPIVDASAFVAPTAVLVGRVSVGSRARIMYGTVLDSEASKIEVGATAIVCENAVLRATGPSTGRFYSATPTSTPGSCKRLGEAIRACLERWLAAVG